MTKVSELPRSIQPESLLGCIKCGKPPKIQYDSRYIRFVCPEHSDVSRVGWSISGYGNIPDLIEKDVLEDQKRGWNRKMVALRMAEVHNRGL